MVPVRSSSSNANPYPFPVSSNSSKAKAVAAMSVMDASSEQTPRKYAINTAVKQSPYHNLADPPSPSGRLADRIVRLKQRCVEALGQNAFEEVYSFLKSFEEDSYYQEASEKEKAIRVKGIVGDGKAHYMPLIEQLIFMEETHAG